SWDGSASMRARNSGLSGTFSGTVCVFAVGCASANGSVDEIGHVEGTARIDVQICVPGTTLCHVEKQSHRFEFDLDPTPAPRDTTAPTMSAPAPKTVTTSATGSTVPVYFEHPTANDNRDGSITATCSPRSGSEFRIDATTS